MLNRETIVPVVEDRPTTQTNYNQSYSKRIDDLRELATEDKKANG